MKKYHINPNTGMPSICRAQKGQCPYGGDSGNENHYDTYSEALIRSQRKLEDDHELLPVNRIALQDLLEVSSDYGEVAWEYEDLPEDNNELKDLIRNTDDMKLIMGIIEGKLLVEDGWDKIGVALQNPNLPRNFINQVIYDSPEDYHIETKRRIMLNPSLTHGDLMHVVDNEEDLPTRTIALKNAALEQEFVDNFLEQRGYKLKELPWYAMLSNPAIEEGTFSNWLLNNSFQELTKASNQAGEINREYHDWMVSYERNQRSDKGHSTELRDLINRINTRYG